MSEFGDLGVSFAWPAWHGLFEEDRAPEGALLGRVDPRGCIVVEQVLMWGDGHQAMEDGLQVVGSLGCGQYRYSADAAVHWLAAAELLGRPFAGVVQTAVDTAWAGGFPTEDRRLALAWIATPDRHLRPATVSHEPEWRYELARQSDRTEEHR